MTDDRRAATAASADRTNGLSGGFPIQAGLIALVMVSLLPVMAVAGWLLYDSYQARERAVYRETVLQARALMSAIDREFAEAEWTLAVLASTPRMDEPDMVAFDDRLRTVPVPQIVRGFVLIDRNGMQVLNTTAPPGVLHDRPATSWGQSKHVFDSGHREFSKLTHVGTDRIPMIAIASPVRRGDQVIYSLNAGIPSVRLTRFLQGQDLPAGWVAALLDGDGTIVARTREAQRYVGQKTVPAVIEKVLASDEGMLESFTKDGDTVIAGFSHSRQADLRMVVGAPKAALTAEVTQGILFVAALAVAITAAALCAAFWLARSMTRAVSGLIDPALALGSGRPVELERTPIREANALARAIFQASRMIDDARHQAHHDPLTGLPNRVLFDELLGHQIHVARRAERPLAILAIDLDHFKEVNDTHGHAAGDLVLKVAADRIKAAVRAADVVSRRGGDEFTVLLLDGDRDIGSRVADEIIDALSAPYPDILPAVTASIGIAVYPSAGSTPDELLHNADAALYAAKDAGKARAGYGDEQSAGPAS